MAVLIFRDRRDAGRRLAGALGRFAHEDVVVLGLPRGGVPVAFEVARALRAPLDVVVVRKLGVPFQPELGMGAIGEGGARILDQEVLEMARVDEADLEAVERREQVEIERRARRFRGDRPRVPLEGRTAIIIDDGVATGSTARVACQVVRAQGAAKIVLAVPVAPALSLAELRAVADEVVCLETPEPFFAVGQWYQDFSQTTDDEVVELLAQAETGATVAPAGDDPPPVDEEVEVAVGGLRLAGRLTLPEGVRGLVVFAHGSGSSRHSPRNRYVAAALNAAGFGTLLFDLLTRDEEVDIAHVFDVELLADRLSAVTSWLRRQPETTGMVIGYFGASTGAAAALWAASEPQAEVAAIVSRGGRPDLAGSRLADVRAPTLLVVGGRDDVVLELNRRALERLRCEKQLAIVPQATHLFEEPGTLESVAGLAEQWFAKFLVPPTTGC